jgi:outer membrane protein assembly factor BamD
MIKLSVVALILFAVVLSCGGKPSLTNRPAKELLDEGIKEYESHKHFNAIELFQSIVYNHPGNPVVDTAQYYLALSYFGNKDYAVAGVEFNRLTVNYPSSAYFENAIFMRAVCYFESTPKHYGLDQSELVTAIKLLEDFIIDFPESRLVIDAQTYLKKANTRLAQKYYQSAVVYRHIGAYIAAKKYYQIVIDDYTNTDYTPNALFEYAEMDLIIGKYAEAHTAFENFLTIFPDHELAEEARKKAREASFQSGVAAFDKGKMDAAKENFELFIKEYPHDDRVSNAKEYLSLIADKQSMLSQDQHAES